MVQCVKLRRELPGLERPPFPGELGQRIFEHVSRQAFDMWQEQQTLIINHYGLNLADPEAKQFLMQEMEAFFFEEQEHVPEGWIPEDQPGGLGPQGKDSPPGAQGKGGGPLAPQGKGNDPPVPQRKQ
jgi:Fe-S cluster biosynthesis and repair protein YggX